MVIIDGYWLVIINGDYRWLVTMNGGYIMQVAHSYGWDGNLAGVPAPRLVGACA